LRPVGFKFARVALIRLSGLSPKQLKRPAHETFLEQLNPDRARLVFLTGKGSSLNTAKASQEVVIRGHIPADHITGVWDAHRVPCRMA
jgi:hypothetical protein